jgi:hypothetical protein
MTMEHTYRTFASLGSSDAINRARKYGSITAVRVLRDPVAMRSLRISVVPFASVSDAQSSVKRAIENIRFKLGSTASTQRDLEDVSVPEVSHVLIREILGAGARGPAGDRLLAGTVDNFLISMSFQAQGSVEESWPLEYITSMATRQARKIREVFNNT